MPRSQGVKAQAILGIGNSDAIRYIKKKKKATPVESIFDDFCGLESLELFQAWPVLLSHGMAAAVQPDCRTCKKFGVRPGSCSTGTSSTTDQGRGREAYPDPGMSLDMMTCLHKSVLDRSRDGMIQNG